MTQDRRIEVPGTVYHPSKGEGHSALEQISPRVLDRLAHFEGSARVVGHVEGSESWKGRGNKHCVHIESRKARDRCGSSPDERMSSPIESGSFAGHQCVAVPKAERRALSHRRGGRSVRCPAAPLARS